MPESPVPDTAPWWERTPPGTPVLLAFVKLDPAGPVQDGQGLPEAEVLQRWARHAAGVEYVANTLGAAQPLHWRDMGVMLFFQGDERKSAVTRALEAAGAIRERILVDFAMQVRIAVHAAVVEWNPETEKLAHPAIHFCQHLEQAAPVNGVAITEDVYLALPEGERQRFALLGVTAREGIAAYVTPASLAAQRSLEAFKHSDDLRLWEAFRRYVGSPEIRRLRYVGFPLQKKQPPSLDIREVFIAPEVIQRREVQSQPFARLLARSRSWVILGDPGSGKTTVLRWLAVLAAGGPLVWAEHLGASERLLPLIVSVGRLAEVRASQGEACSVMEALAAYFQDRNLGDATGLHGFLLRTLEAGHCLVLLDGLDEVRSETRATLLPWLKAFCAAFPRNHFIASARRIGYAGFSLPEGLEAQLQPFSDAQVRRYVQAFEHACWRWENEGIPDDASAHKVAEQLLEALSQNTRLRELARNPFLLSALMLIHRAQGKLPRHRVQAYEVFARTLCETWGQARRVVAGESAAHDIRYEEEAIPILGGLALRMHQQWTTGVAPEAFVIQALAQALQAQEGGDPGKAERAARTFLERAGEEVQLLQERGTGQWGFLHLTFQEFFTAVGLLSFEQFEEVALEHLFDSRWEEVLRLGVGYMALIQNRGHATQRFIRQVLEHQEHGPRRFLTELLQKQVYLATLLASEAGDVLPLSLQQRIAHAAAAWVVEMPDDVTFPLLEELALTDFASNRLREALAAQLNSAKDWERFKSLQALGILGGTQSLPALSSLVRDTSAIVRIRLCQILADLDSVSGREELEALAHDADESVRKAAIDSVRSSKKVWADDFLRKELQIPDHLDVPRYFSTTFFADEFDSPLIIQVMEEKPGLQKLLEGARHQDPSIRAAALFQLMVFEDTQATQLLLESLSDPDPQVRRASIDALSTHNTPEVLNALVQHARSTTHPGEKNLMRKVLWRLAERLPEGLS